MKVFTQTFDIAFQSPKRFWVAPHSDFKIGVKIVKNGTPVENEFSVFNGDTELTPDEDLVNGFTTFTLKSNDTGSVEYKVVVDGVGETLKITQIVTDSTVFEMDASGGGVPADVATQGWVENYVSAQTSAFIDETALSSYATTSAVEAAISTATTDMATQTWVGQQGYVSQNDLSSYATTSAMESYVSTATSSFITASALTPYATTSAMESYVDSQIGAVLSSNF